MEQWNSDHEEIEVGEIGEIDILSSRTSSVHLIIIILFALNASLYNR
jgi:hypothetical protein